MKRKLYCSVILGATIGLFSFINAQTIKKGNLSKANIELLEKLEKQELDRINRIEAFLRINKNVVRSKNVNGTMSSIYDIVGNRPIYRSTANREAGRATKTNHLQTGGSLGLNLDGTSMTVGVWDGGPAEFEHAEFLSVDDTGSRITVVDNSNVDGSTGTSSNHGTHVTGTIISKGVNNISSRGMAPNANVKSYNWTNDEAEMVLAVNDVINPIIISNHSYGVWVAQDDGPLDAWIMGSYRQDSRDIDDISKTNPKYLIVGAAGNDGNTNYSGGLYSGYDKLTYDKTAKNSLVVANANPSLVPFSYELSSLFINGSSSQGPTDDLRVKPDLAADGTNLLSTVPNGGYATLSGTSMAAPNTTGTLLLLQQYYEQLNGSYMNSSTLKGLACHTSVDDIVTIGPDPIFGWGFLDAKASAEVIAGAGNDAVLEELTLDEGATYTYTFSAQAGDKLRASICWTDMPGDISTAGVVNDPTPRLVNDLDLRLSKDGNTFFPWKLDYSSMTGFSNSKADNIVDNIEVVDIDAPETGMYTLTVTHKGTLKGNVGGPFSPQSQDFGLVITGNNLVLGVDDIDFSGSLVVFPNPNKGEFEISFNSNSNNSNEVNIDIYDLHGRLVYKKVFANNSATFRETININEVQSGVYIANISKGNNTTIRKIIIE